jgi:lipopolysaccharide biosynthesis glycosyltransferase/glycosyltransferase involved in cell wall biosynthesis
MMNKGLDKINICFAIDDKYAEHCSVAIVSILKNSCSMFHFYILNSGLSIENKQNIERLKNIRTFEITFIEVNLNHFENCYLPPGAHFSLANYYRLKVASLLPHLDKVIYLDSDIIANRDLRELWEISLEDYSVGACKAMTYESNSERLGLSTRAPYINSGVLVLNLKKIRKNKIEDKFFNCIKENPERMQNVDQDVINLVLLEASDGIKQLQQNWNTEYRTDQPFKKEYLPILNEPYIIHFVTGDKPWNPDSKQLHKEKYWEYRKYIEPWTFDQWQSRESFIIEKYFNNDRTVRNGPFKGMNYSAGKSIGSTLLPKIYGSYEAPIQKWIQEVISNKYQNIIDIGCAEGYYAVGLALTSQNSKVYAYDTDAEALLLCKELARSNNVESKINFNDLCTHKKLENFGSKKTLVICDIEGEELHLLEPSLAGGLQYADIIVETHDFIVDGISDTLINRFKHTHKIEIIIDYERESKTALGENISEEIWREIIDEKRPVGMKWLRMISLKKYQQQSVCSDNYAQRDNKYITQMIKKCVKNKKGVVYTCITGGYDALVNHTFVDHDWDYVCFTDDLSIGNVDNDSWQVRPLFFNKLDNTRNQRWHKIHPHILFPEYKKSIWLDANINILNKDVFADIDRAMADSCLISVAPHPERNCIYDELIACVALGKDDEGVMRKQVDLIKSAGFPEKKGLFETNIMYRAHHNDRVIEIMKDWWWWVENYSRRDQLSLSYVLWQHKLEVRPLTNTSYRYSDGIEFIDSPNHVTKEELIVQRYKLKQALVKRDDQIANINQKLNDLKPDPNHVTIAYKEALRTIEEIRSSSSWRVTAPMRFVSSKIKNTRAILKLLPSIVRFGGGLAGSAKKTWRVFSREGWSGVKRRILFVGGNQNGFVSSMIRPDLTSAAVERNDYAEWLRRYEAMTNTDREQIALEIVNFQCKPIISIVMPVYNPKPEWLIEAIESVCKQIYPYWELCIADDASTDKRIRPILENYAGKDERIKVVFREKNGNISSASNSALSKASGEWVALLDHDDLLAEHALFFVADAINQNPDTCLIYSDEDKIDASGKRFDPYFKCDWNADLFYSQNMISHLGAYRGDLLREIGGFREGLEGAQDYDLALRFIERSKAKQIIHIPRILYHWRAHSKSTAKSIDTKPYAVIAGERALTEHFCRQGIKATAENIGYGYRVRYALPDSPPRVSLIIPTRNKLSLLKKCVESIQRKTSYPDYEMIIVDNASDDPLTIQYLRELQLNPGMRVVRDDWPFNFSALNNAAVKLAGGEIIGLLNNDLEVISSEWLSEMVSHALLPGVGAVGAKLWYPDDTLQHGGVILGLGGVAGHSHCHLPRQHYGYFGRAVLTSSFSVVSAACLVIRKSIYHEVGGFNEDNLAVAFNDVDFCLRIAEAGYRNVWTPYAELYHHESATRGYENTAQKQKRFVEEVSHMKRQWGDVLMRDPAYSPNLTLEYEDFSLAWPPRIEKW